MPYSGFSFFRLKEHFRKFWAIYIAGCVICGCLSSIVFTSTTPQTPIEQEVLVYLVDSYTDYTKLDHVAADMLEYGQSVDETLLEIVFEPIQYTDPETDYYSSMILVTRLALGEGDAYIANSYSQPQLLGTEAYLPLEDYLADGWLEGLEFETISHTSEETGETHIAGIRLDNFPALAELGAINHNGAVLMIACNSTNVETTMEVIEHMMIGLSEGTYAHAESTEPAA